MHWFDDVKKYYIYRGLKRRFVWPILILYMLDRGLSLTQIAIIAFVGYAMSIVFEIPSGIGADVMGHRRTLVLSMMGQGVSMLLYLGGTFWWIMAGSVLYMFCRAFASGTQEALFFERLVELGRADEHQKLAGRARGAAGAIGITFMLTASIAYVYMWWLPFVIGFCHLCLGAYIIGTFTQARRVVSVERIEGYRHILYHFTDALKQIRSIRLLYWIVIINGVIIGISMATIEFHQVVLKDVGLAVALFGTVYAGKRVIALLFAPMAHIVGKRLTPPLFFTYVGILMTVYLCVVFISSHMIIVVAAILFNSMIQNILRVVANDYINDLLPSGSRATALSISNMMSNVVTLIFVGFVTLMSMYLGVRPIFGVIAVLLVGILMGFLPFLYASFRHRRHIC